MREVKKTTNEILETYIKLLKARPEFRCELEHMLADELANAK